MGNSVGIGAPDHTPSSILGSDACATIISLHAEFSWKLLLSAFLLGSRQIQPADSQGSLPPVLFRKRVFWSLLHAAWGCVPPVCRDVVTDRRDRELWASLLELIEQCLQVDSRLSRRCGGHQCQQRDLSSGSAYPALGVRLEKTSVPL